MVSGPAGGASPTHTLGCLLCSRLVVYVWDREGLKLERGATCRSDEVCEVRHRGELRMEAAGRGVGLACAPQRERQLPAAERRATRAAGPVPGLCPGGLRRRCRLLPA